MSRKIIKKTLTIYKRQKPTNNLLNADFLTIKPFRKLEELSLWEIVLQTEKLSKCQK